MNTIDSQTTGLNVNVSCKKHLTKRIEYVCVKPNCEYERIYCTACVFKKTHCRHDEYIRDLEEILSEQKKELEMQGLFLAPEIHNCYVNKQKQLGEYLDIIRSQENIIDDEIDTMIKDMTSALEGIRKAMHNQLKLYIENFKSTFETLEANITENFATFYLSKFSSFEELMQSFSPLTTESLLQMLQSMLKGYPEQFKIPEEIQTLYNTIQSMKEDAPQFDLKRFNSIKGYFNVFKDKLLQNLSSLINVEDEESSLKSNIISVSNLYKDNNKSPLPVHKDLNNSRFSQSPPYGSRRSHNAVSGIALTDRGRDMSNFINSNEVSFVSNKNDQSMQSRQSIGRDSSRMRNVSKSVNDKAFGRNYQTVEIRRIQLSTSFESFHSRTILCLLHLKNSLIASSSDDGMIKLWDIITFRCVKVLKGHTAGVRSLSLLGNGDLVSGSWDKTIKIWKTGDLVSKYNGDSQVMKLSEHSMTLKGHLNAVLVVHVMTDGRTIMSGSTDYTIKLWDSENGQCFKTFSGHNGEVLSLASRADNRIIVSGGGDRTIKIWNAEKKTNLCIDTLSGHTGPVWCIRLLSDDDTIASSSPDKMIKLWSINKAQCIKTILGHQNHVLNLCEFKDKSLLSCDNEGVMKIWSLATAVCINTIQNQTGPIHALATTNDYMVVGAGGDKRIYIWN